MLDGKLFPIKFLDQQLSDETIGLNPLTGDALDVSVMNNTGIDVRVTFKLGFPEREKKSSNVTDLKYLFFCILLGKLLPTHVEKILVLYELTVDAHLIGHLAVDDAEDHTMAFPLLEHLFENVT